jgi:hypothetical protein
MTTLMAEVVGYDDNDGRGGGMMTMMAEVVG